MKVRKYTDATVVHLKNKRVRVIEPKRLKGDIIIEFVNLSDDMSSRSVHLTLKNKAVVTGVKITRESAEALMDALFIQLNRNKND